MSSNDLYDRKFSGKIKLKGVSKLLKKKKKESHEPTTSLDADKKLPSSHEFIGTGRIVSSGVTVQGFETKFVDEVEVNDKLVIEHPLTHGTEERFVQCVMTNRTLTLDEPFSVDLITTIPYNIRKNPKKLPKEGDLSGNKFKYSEKKSSTVSVREKAGMWSYKNVTKTVKGNLSAEDKLNERVKLSRDKYCW